MRFVSIHSHCHHVLVDDLFAPPSLGIDEDEEDDSPFSHKTGLFSTGGGLFDDNQDEVTVTLDIDNYLLVSSIVCICLCMCAYMCQLFGGSDELIWPNI